jgi:Spy/CpxP family protein refolding chaperone
MRNLFKVFVVLAVMALVASPALTQQPRPPFGGGGGFGGPTQLLTNKSVQEELKITEDQVKKIEEASKTVADLGRQRGELFRDRNLSREDREKKTTELNEKIAKANEELTKNLGTILKPEQTKRLSQIQLQQSIRQRGPAALTEEKIQVALKLTDDQKEKIKVIGEEYSTESRALRGFDQETRQKRAALAQEKLESATKVLTAEQRKAFKEMQGEPFEVRFERPTRPEGTQPGGNRPGGNRPGGNRPGGDRPPERRNDF